MGSITLKNIRVYGFHGCLVEEGQIGSEYLVNLTVKANLKTPAATDDLSDTVDYVQLNNIVKEEMAIRSKLLEHVCQRIIDRILSSLEMVTSVSVNVAKVNPPIGGDVASVSVTMEAKR